MPVTKLERLVSQQARLAMPLQFAILKAIVEYNLMEVAGPPTYCYYQPDDCSGGGSGGD